MFAVSLQKYLINIRLFGDNDVMSFRDHSNFVKDSSNFGMFLIYQFRYIFLFIQNKKLFAQQFRHKQLPNNFFSSQMILVFHHKQLCQQNNSLIQYKMGNLQMGASRSPFPRKPIFSQENSLRMGSMVRSLSPNCTKINNSKISLNKSIINFGHTKSPAKDILINSKMINSVIKNSTPEAAAQSRIKFYKKSCENQENNNMHISKTPKRFKMTSKQKISQSSFRQSNPIKTKVKDCIQNSIALRQALEKQLVSHRKQQQKYHKIQTQQYINSKSPRILSSMSKTVQSNNNSARNQKYSQGFLCNNQNFNKVFQQFQNVQVDASMSQNVPTQRKRPVKLFDSSQEQSRTESSKFKIQSFSGQNQDTSRTAFENVCAHKQNRQKCQEIIKRVRNFNQFLNEVKKKLKKETELVNSNNNNFSNISIQQSSQNTSLDQCNNSMNSEFPQKLNKFTKSITMALKLENQKIQLEKYKKLVERQLSKQHSIESISIQGKNKQKVITIKVTQQKLSNIPNLIPIKQNSSKSKMKISKTEEIAKEQKVLNQRVSKINNLMDKLEGMNKIQNQNYQKLSQFLKSDSETALNEEDH